MSRTWRLLRLVIAALGAWSLAGAALAQPPVWIVRSKTAQVVLFGSVHVLPPSLEWEPPVLRAALAHATDVWFELPVDPQTEAATRSIALQLGLLPTDQSLLRLLPKDVAARMTAVAMSYDVNLAVLDKSQPWFAEIELASVAYLRAGAVEDVGPEKVLSVQAPAKAARHAFETPEQQLRMFSGAPFDEQVASLDETLKEMRDDPDEYKTLLQAWLNGDVARLEAEALTPLRKVSPDLFRRIVTERNERWVETIARELKGRRREVVVVGVGHLIGPGGVPARLRALGYSVEGP